MLRDIGGGCQNLNLIHSIEFKQNLDIMTFWTFIGHNV